MLKLYLSNKHEYPIDKVEINNDSFFNHYFDAEKLVINKRMAEIIKRIDDTVYDSASNTIKSKYNPSISLSPKYLSTGCKTVLNVMAFPCKIFSIGECGENAISELLSLSNELSEGSIFIHTFFIPELGKEIAVQVIDIDTGNEEDITNTTQLFDILGAYFSKWGYINMLYSTYNIETNGVEFSLELKDNLVLVSGLSGCGKTMLFKAIKEDATVHKKNIICINKDYENDLPYVKHLISGSRNNLIVIDNSDILLTLEMKLEISLDENNQYLIFTQSTEGFRPSADSFAELIVENKRGSLNYYLKWGLYVKYKGYISGGNKYGT